jgi:hypothetical protein
MLKIIDVSNCRNGFFHSKGSHNFLSVLKDIECTDYTAGFGRKMFNFYTTVFAVPVVHQGQLHVLFLYLLCVFLF